MNQRILVAFTSRYGSTREVAEAIARRLGERADVKEVRSVESLSGYDGVVVGAPIYFDRWQPEAADFVRRHHAELRDRPVWLFAVAGCGRRATEDDRAGVARVERWLASFQPDVRPRGIAVFAGRLERRRLGLLMRLAIWFRERQGPVPDGDFRDWAAVAAWADAVAAQLSLTPPPPPEPFRPEVPAP